MQSNKEKLNIEKLAQTVGYMLDKYDGIINYTKLIKMLYLADKEAIKQTGYAITGDSYASLPMGPVLSSLYDLIKGNYGDPALQYYWKSLFVTDIHELHKVCSFIPKGELSPIELEILDSIDSKYHHYTYSDMINVVHDKNICPEWTETTSSEPITKESIYASLGFTEKQIKMLEDEERSYQAEKVIINSIPSTIAL